MIENPLQRMDMSEEEVAKSATLLFWFCDRLAMAWGPRQSADTCDAVPLCECVIVATFAHCISKKCPPALDIVLPACPGLSYSCLHNCI